MWPSETIRIRLLAEARGCRMLLTQETITLSGPEPLSPKSALVSPSITIKHGGRMNVHILIIDICVDKYFVQAHRYHIVSNLTLWGHFGWSSKVCWALTLSVSGLSTLEYSDTRNIFTTILCSKYITGALTTVERQLYPCVCGWGGVQREGKRAWWPKQRVIEKRIWTWSVYSTESRRPQ